LKKNHSKIIAKKGLFRLAMYLSFVYVVGMTMLNLGIVHAVFPLREMEEEMRDVFVTTVMDLSIFFPVFLLSLVANLAVISVFLFLSRFVSVAYSYRVFEIWTWVVLGVIGLLALSFFVSLFYDAPAFVRYGSLPVAMSIFGALITAQSLVFYGIIRQRDEEFAPFEVIASVINRR
jgi:hypothetical protein